MLRPPPAVVAVAGRADPDVVPRPAPPLLATDDLDESVPGQVKAQLKAPDFGDVIKQVYGNNFGDSIEDVGQAISDTANQIDRLGQMSDQELGHATEQAIALRDAFGIEVNESMNATNALMENFGLTFDEAFGFVQAGMQNGLNASDDFLDSIGEYSVQFAEGGANAGQFFNLMDTGLQSGMLGTDKAADLFKEFRVRIQDGSAGTQEALAAIGIDADDMAARFADGSLTAIDAFNEVRMGLQMIDDENVRFNAGVALMGGQFEDLGASAVLGIDTALQSFDEILGSTTDLNTQYDTMGSFLEGLKRRAQVGLAPIGDTLLDLGERLMPLVNDAFGWFEENIIPAIESGAETVQQFLDTFVGGMEDGQSPLDAFRNALAEVVPPDVLAKFDEIVDVVQRFIEKVQIFVSEHGEELKGALLAIGAALAAAAIVAGIMGIVGAITALLSPVGLVIAIVGLLGAAWAGNWGGIQEKTKAVLAWLDEKITMVLTAIQDFWAEHGDTILAKADEAWQAVQNAIDTVLSIIEDLWLAWQAAREGDWETFGEKLREAWDKAWEAIKTALSNAGTAILELFSGIILDIIAKVTETDWLQLGKDIIQGIANGIDLAAGKIGDIVKTAVQNAIDAAKAFLGISSPSKVTMEQIGLPMGEGVALGVEHSIPDTEAAMANLTGSMLGVPAVAGSGGSGAGSADNIFNFDFTNALITNKNELERWIDQALAKRGIQADQRRRI